MAGKMSEQLKCRRCGSVIPVQKPKKGEVYNCPNCGEDNQFLGFKITRETIKTRFPKERNRSIFYTPSEKEKEEMKNQNSLWENVKWIFVPFIVPIVNIIYILLVGGGRSYGSNLPLVFVNGPMFMLARKIVETDPIFSLVIAVFGSYFIYLFYFAVFRLLSAGKNLSSGRSFAILLFFLLILYVHIYAVVDIAKQLDLL